MFCPQCGHQQTSDTTRFCSRCGFSLDLITSLLANSDQQLQREKREVTGITMMTTTFVLLLNFIIVFGLITLPHMANPGFLILWLSFFAIALTTGGIGLWNLVRSGFFRKWKERELRLQLAKLEQKRQALPEKSTISNSEVRTMPISSEPGSVTERTTRELQSIPNTDSQNSSLSP